MSALIDTGDIARLLGVTREHVTNRITKRSDFPRPEVNISRKIRRWDEAQVLQWLRGYKRAAMSDADSR